MFDYSTQKNVRGQGMAHEFLSDMLEYFYTSDYQWYCLELVLKVGLKVERVDILTSYWIPEFMCTGVRWQFPLICFS